MMMTIGESYLQIILYHINLFATRVITRGVNNSLNSIARKELVSKKSSMI